MKLKNIIFGFFFGVAFMSVGSSYAAPAPANANASYISVSGNVSDEMGPLVGVNISVPGTSTGTITGDDGGYVLAIPKGSELQYSYIGYDTVKKSFNSTVREDVKMKETANQLTELVVSGGTLDLYNERVKSAEDDLFVSWDSILENLGKNNSRSAETKLKNLTEDKNKIAKTYTDKMNDRLTGGPTIKGLLKAVSVINKEKESVSEKRHQATIDEVLAKLNAKFDDESAVLRNQMNADALAKKKECEQATNNLKTSYLGQWSGIKANAEKNPPPEANERLTALQTEKSALDENLGQELNKLYGNSGLCAGETKPKDLLGIGPEYSALVQTLKGQLSAAQRACNDAKEPIVAALKNAWGEAQRIAKDTKANPEPSVRQQLAAAKIDPAITTYRSEMKKLHESGLCSGVSKWDEATDKYFQSVLNGWENLKRQLAGEGPVDYQDEATLNKLKDDAAAAKAKEQSTANKLLSGGSMLASSIGGMQLMQGMTERSADKDADADMRAYMDTFRCGIGDAGNFNIRDTGTVQVIPGYGATTMALKSEYTNLAIDTAAKKNALGLQPGIESELVLDTTHLYSSDAIGLVRENRFDTAADRVASNDAKTRMIAGGAMLGVGVVGGVVGNLLINRDKDDDATKSALIGNRYNSRADCLAAIRLEKNVKCEPKGNKWEVKADKNSNNILDGVKDGLGAQVKGLVPEANVSNGSEQPVIEEEGSTPVVTSESENREEKANPECTVSVTDDEKIKAFKEWCKAPYTYKINIDTDDSVIANHICVLGTDTYSGSIREESKKIAGKTHQEICVDAAKTLNNPGITYWGTDEPFGENQRKETLRCYFRVQSNPSNACSGTGENNTVPKSKTESQTSQNDTSAKVVERASTKGGTEAGAKSGDVTVTGATNAKGAIEAACKEKNGEYISTGEGLICKHVSPAIGASTCRGICKRIRSTGYAYLFVDGKCSCLFDDAYNGEQLYKSVNTWYHNYIFAVAAPEVKKTVDKDAGLALAKKNCEDKGGEFMEDWVENQHSYPYLCRLGKMTSKSTNEDRYYGNNNFCTKGFCEQIFVPREVFTNVPEPSIYEGGSRCVCTGTIPKSL